MRYFNFLLKTNLKPDSNYTILRYDAVVDDIELYLEMMADTPRGPKIAKLLKGRILKVDTDG